MNYYNILLPSEFALLYTWVPKIWSTLVLKRDYIKRDRQLSAKHRLPVVGILIKHSYKIYDSLKHLAHLNVMRLRLHDG